MACLALRVSQDCSVQMKPWVGSTELSIRNLTDDQKFPAVIQKTQLWISYKWKSEKTKKEKWTCQSVVPNSCDPMGCSLPGSSVRGIFQTRILEWVVIPFSRRSSWPRDQTWVSCIAGGFFTAEPLGKHVNQPQLYIDHLPLEPPSPPPIPLLEVITSTRPGSLYYTVTFH